MLPLFSQHSRHGRRSIVVGLGTPRRAARSRNGGRVVSFSRTASGGLNCSPGVFSASGFQTPGALTGAPGVFINPSFAPCPSTEWRGGFSSLAIAPGKAFGGGRHEIAPWVAKTHTHLSKQPITEVPHGSGLRSPSRSKGRVGGYRAPARGPVLDTSPITAERARDTRADMAATNECAPGLNKHHPHRKG